MSFELPKFESTLKSTSTATPNLSFNPGANVESNIAQVALEKQRLQMQANQQSQENVLHTVDMASKLAQTFVEASKQRQQRDAIAAYAAIQPNKNLAPVMKAFPEETAQKALASNFPTTIQGIAANQLQNTGKVAPNVIETAQELQKPQAPKLTQILGPNGQPSVVSVDPRTNKPTVIGPAVPKAVGGNGTSSDSLVNKITDSVMKDPSYVKADQKETDIKGARAGLAQAIADPSTGVTALAGMEAVKSVVSQRFTQQEWEKTLPNTGVKNYASAMEWLSNNPQDPKAGAFLKKLDAYMAVEQATQETQKHARAEQILKSKDSLLKPRPDLAKNLYQSLGVNHQQYNPAPDQGWQDAGGGIKWRIKQ